MTYELNREEIEQGIAEMYEQLVYTKTLNDMIPRPSKIRKLNAKMKQGFDFDVWGEMEFELLEANFECYTW